MKFREDTENSLLEINIGQVDVLDYQVEMVNRNSNLKILRFDKLEENGDTVLSFNLEKREKLLDYLTSKEFSKEEILKLIIDILDIIIGSNDYLLSENNFLLDINLMYYETFNSKFEIIYVPLVKKISDDINRDFRELIKKIIVDLVNFTQEYEHDGFIGSLLKITKSDNLDIKEIKRKVEKMLYGNNFIRKEAKLMIDENIKYFESGIIKESNNTETSKEKKSFKSEDLYSFIEDRGDKYQYPKKIMAGIIGLQIVVVGLIIALVVINGENEDQKALVLISLILILMDMITVKFLLQYRIEKEDIEFEEKEELEEEFDLEEKSFINIGKKEIISQNVYRSERLEKTGPYFLLINDEITERVYITRNNFIIGRFGNECDYIINNNTIGKKHLKVVKENDTVYIEDLNSKNGTYINGKRIESGCLYKVEENFKIKISNVVLTFKEI